MRISNLQIFSVLASCALYFGAFNLNQLIFSKLEFAHGVNWIYLPAGLRLLCTLLLAGEGAIGIVLGSFLVIQFIYPATDSITGIGAAIISGGAPYLTYRLALFYGMPSSLQQLTAARLSALIVIYAALSSFLHQLWYVERGTSPNLITGFGAMFIGDLAGTLIVVYLMKMTLALLRKSRLPH